jgi:ATP-binding cassette subfamily B protein
VGPTGAGKSTLMSLLPRLYDPQYGRVIIDGHDVRDLTLESLRAQFSIVLQEPLLFSGTIAENIGYGRPGCSQADIEESARAANAHDFIHKLPQKYQTPLGERGAKISGGERQRIAVARAFLRDAPILILDEPTSSIDSRTEAVILEALERLMQGRTTIMIAHRLSTIRSVDRILVLNDGELVEQGTHKSLVARHGLYRQLWQAQTRHRQRVQAAREAMAKVEAVPVPPVELIEPAAAPRPSRNGTSRNGAKRTRLKTT